jgi:hypothetical protein
MGWSFACDPRFNKKALVAQLRSPGYLSPGYEMLKSSVVGNNFWYLYRQPDGQIYIGLTLMKGGGRNYGWGEKGIGESWGPSEVNCPLAYLDEASAAPNSFATEWREKVRQYHADKKSRPAYAEGQIWEAYSGRQYRLVWNYPNRRGWEVKDMTDGYVYRAGFKFLAGCKHVGWYVQQAA